MFRRVVLNRRNTKKDGCGTLGLMNMTEMLRWQVENCGNVDKMFRPGHESLFERTFPKYNLGVYSNMLQIG